MDERVVASKKCWIGIEKMPENRKFVKNIVMNEEFMKNSVLNAKIDPKLVMNWFILKIGGWKMYRRATTESWYTFMDENEPWLLIGIPNRHSFFVTQYLERHCASSGQHMKKLMSLREGLHVMMQCYLRQYFADRY